MLYDAMFIVGYVVIIGVIISIFYESDDDD